MQLQATSRRRKEIYRASQWHAGARVISRNIADVLGCRYQRSAAMTRAEVDVYRSNGMRRLTVKCRFSCVTHRPNLSHSAKRYINKLSNLLRRYTTRHFAQSDMREPERQSTRADWEPANYVADSIDWLPRFQHGLTPPTNFLAFNSFLFFLFVQSFVLWACRGKT